MAVRDYLASLFGARPTHHVEFLGPTFQNMILGLTPEELYRTQPHLRTVLSFVARNVAHLGLQSFDRVSDQDRRRLTKDPLPILLRRPNPSMTRYELIESLVSDLGLYDIAYWLLVQDAEQPSGWLLQPIPPSWVTEQRGGTFFQAASYTIQNPDGSRVSVDAEDMIVFHGWNPGRPKHGTSPVETLKQILAEQVQAWSYRQQVWQRGGRVGAYMTRPAGVKWTDAARERFMEQWKARWTGMDGAKAGGTPILEDGMELKRLGFNAREEQWAEVSRVALSTVASVYHVNPVMVGVLDNANFSNTKEFRKMLYSETLGPMLAMIEDRVNAFLVPKVSKAENPYVEFNIEEKLQGDFEEQAAVMSSSTGAPWMTRNEARALRNLPAIEGGDTLVVPLNVLIGGQASPRDSGSQNRNEGPVSVKAAGALEVKASQVKNEANYEALAEQVLDRFFARQRAAVLGRLKSKSPVWWNAERWDNELSDDLLKLSLSVATAIGVSAMRELGFSADDYDESRTVQFLTDVARKRAEAINATTRDQIEDILDGTGPEGVTDPAHVFDIAQESRIKISAVTLVTTLAAFATVEAGKQVPRVATKTWIVTSSNPRATHAYMNGETVGIEDEFSNGAKWPGDSSALDVDDVAGCLCDVLISVS